MDSTDFALAMVSGILIIMVIFLFILLKIFGNNKKNRPIVTLLPEITKIEPNESLPEKLAIKPHEIEGLEKKFQQACEFQKMASLNETAQIPKDIKEETLKVSPQPIKEEPISQHVMQSNEENEDLKLEDILIEIRGEKTKKKARAKSSSNKDIEEADELKESEIPEKKLIKRPAHKKSDKDSVPKRVSKEPEEKPPRKKSNKKVIKEKKMQAIVDENPGSGEL